MDKKFFRLPALLAATLFAAVAVSPVQAATLTLQLDREFSGAQPPQGVAPWLTAVFNDSFGGANTVRLSMEAINLVDEEAVANWYFNFDPGLDASQLTFTPVDTVASTPNSVTGSNDNFQADGDGLYDILFDFPPPPGNSPSRFTAGEQVIYDITYVAPIDASSFDFFSAPMGGSGPFLSASHVQRIADPGFCDGSTLELTGACGSGWIGAVPVPAAVWLFGSGLLGLFGIARRRRS